MEYNKEHKVPVIDLGVQPVDIKAINILPSTKKDAVEVPVSTPSVGGEKPVFSFGASATKPAFSFGRPGRV